jgi:hypothetical protein
VWVGWALGLPVQRELSTRGRATTRSFDTVRQVLSTRLSCISSHIRQVSSEGVSPRTERYIGCIRDSSGIYMHLFCSQFTANRPTGQSLDTQNLLTQELLACLETFKVANVSGLDADVSVLKFSSSKITQGKQHTHPPCSMSPMSLPIDSVGFHMTTSSKPRMRRCRADPSP